MEPYNPFLIAGYHSPKYFCDRRQETADLTGALYNGRNLTLISPRRMGKTGLVKNAFYLLKEEHPDIITLYMDIYSTLNLNDFVQLLATTVLGSLDSAPQKAMKRIVKFIKSCRPGFTFDEKTGIPKIVIDVAPASEEATLKEIFEYLQSSEKRCYIAIDEFQQIAEYPEKNVEALLRSYIQFLPLVNFVFAGSKQHVMQEMFLSAKRPFYQSTQILSLESIDRQEYYTFAAEFFSNRQTELSEETFANIYDAFGGHTWYIQAVFNRLYSFGRTPDTALVNEAVEEIISESTFAYETLLSAYTPANIRLLKAIAHEGCVKEINAGEFINKYRLKAASSINSSLKKLVDKELVYKSLDGYSVYDRFMAVWLRRLP